MSRIPWVVVLSGPSSSGKTSLARELHQQLPEPAWLFVADECFPKPHPSAAAHEENLEAAIVVFHRALSLWAASGRNVIIDGALPYGDPALRTACLDELGNFRTYIIAIDCTVTELRRREAHRPDPRLPGWAERQHADIHDGLPIALHIDTTEITSAAAARTVLNWLYERR